jgi:uncharacterized protein YjeT (DUF2065 family)
MSELQRAATIVGAILVTCGLFVMIRPDDVRSRLAKFPRSKTAARLLTAVDLLWVAWVLHQETAVIAGISWARAAVIISVPIAFLLLVFFMDELLAARALGGFLLLSAHPVLRAAFLETPWRVVIAALAYVWIIAGMILLMSPYRFRQASALMLKTNQRSRVTGGALAGGGLVILALGMTVY